MKTRIGFGMAIAAIASALGVIACGSPCEHIADRIAECNPNGAEIFSCSGSPHLDCDADCYDKASCDDIVNVNTSKSSGTLEACVAACESGSSSNATGGASASSSSGS